VLLAVEAGDRRLCFLIGRHFDKSESFAPAGFAVVNDLCRDDLSMLTKELFQLRAIDAVAQVADIQLLTHHETPEKNSTIGSWLRMIPWEPKGGTKMK
jgi:hypothetical protein